jgi:chromosome segregation ATPase
MVIELSREVKSLKESKNAKADMNNKLHDENEELRQQVRDLKWQMGEQTRDLKWQAEDEKDGLEKEIQLGKDEIAQLNDELDRIKKAAAVQGRENRKLQTTNEALITAAHYWRKESKNSRHYAKELERIINKLLNSGE